MSDSFLGEQKEIGDFEWTATILNLKPEEDMPLNKNCTPLYHYVKFVSMITENLKAGMDKQIAIEKAVDEAISQNLLGDFFKINRAEVIGMCLTEYDEELAKRTWHEDGRTEGLAEGREEGRAEKAVEAAIMLIKEFNMDPEIASQKIGAPLEKVIETLKVTC